MGGGKPKRSKRDLWFKLGRFITVVTLACFFLPFFGVSCDGLDVVHVSGADMVGGCKPGGIATEPTKEIGDGGRQGKPVVEVDNVPREPLAIAAFALALVVAGLSWVRSRRATIAAFALSIASIGALAGLYVKLRGDLDDRVVQQVSRESASNVIMKDAVIESGTRFGLWLTLGGLIGIAALSGLAAREQEHAPGGPPPA